LQKQLKDSPLQSTPDVSLQVLWNYVLRFHWYTHTVFIEFSKNFKHGRGQIVFCIVA